MNEDYISEEALAAGVLNFIETQIHQGSVLSCVNVAKNIHE